MLIVSIHYEIRMSQDLWDIVAIITSQLPTIAILPIYNLSYIQPFQLLYRERRSIDHDDVFLHRHPIEAARLQFTS